ncbi:DUF1353 domain protein [Campylobacter vicugnae]|uniref:DUF1353 domain protein n=1 Tax=Campylobacter vicugnae TaxID=1660076 RepID=A0A1X9T1G9_9BACT|nr:DUF1353 domain-containing protein [Campylobacter sp. RM8964]ARR02219.1 DUF1353 domain protein [Campylobacter sp. RM8964]
MDRVVVQPIGKDKFILYKDFSYQGVYVARGFVTNGANIPRVFWSLFPPNSPEYLSAVVLHDYMCKNVKLYGYEKVDRYFYEAMIEIGVSKWKAKLFYFCVKWYHRFKVFK